MHGPDERPERRNSAGKIIALIVGVVVVLGLLAYAFTGSNPRKSDNAALNNNTTAQQPEPGGAPAPKQSETTGSTGNAPPPTNP